jgi:signal transduction histidine kinase
LKFTPSGGTVRVDLQRSESYVRTRVTDNGRGIKPEFLPCVFDWFQQEGPDTRDGLGLGLPLVQKIVELHGGTVRADSEGPGRGAAFTVTLPTAEAITESRGWSAAE